MQPVYEAANNTNKSIKAISHFSDGEFDRVQELLNKLGMLRRRDVVLIDARDDNEPSGSNAQ